MKKKLKLTELHVQSFTTTFSKEEISTIKGGVLETIASCGIVISNCCSQAACVTNNEHCFSAPCTHACGGHNGSALPAC